jgi:peptide/nickel transport system permease protein
MTEGYRPSWRRMLRAFVASPTGIVSGVGGVALLVLSVLGPFGFGSSANTVNVVAASQGHTSAHSMGTDGLGRDIFMRTLAATRTSLTLAIAAVAIAVVLGGLIGGILASSGPRTRKIGGGAIDTLMSFGAILLAIVVVTIVGIGSVGAVAAIGTAFTPLFARFTYSLVAGVMARDYLAAARVVGVGRRRLFTHYVMRNVADSMAIASFSALGDAIIAMSSLSFLGLGVQSPTFDWGQMLTDGVQNFYLNPYAALAPAVMITLTGLIVALFGDAVARAANPVLWDERPRLFNVRHKEPVGDS